MRKDLAKAVADENAKHTDSERLKEQYEEIKQVNMRYYAEASGFQREYERVETLHQRKAMREENIKDMMTSLKILHGESSCMSACIQAHRQSQPRSYSTDYAISIIIFARLKVGRPNS